MVTLIQDNFRMYVCLHTLPSWNKTNNEERERERTKKISSVKIKHCLLMQGMGGFSPSKVSGAGIVQWFEC